MKAFAAPLPTIVIARMIGVPEMDPRPLQGVVEPPDARAGTHSPTGRTGTRLPEPPATRRVLHGDRRAAPPRAPRRSRFTAGGSRGTGGQAHSRRDDRDASPAPDSRQRGDRNLIGNGVRALLQHPDQLALLREQPELIPSAVEELLRYDSPSQLDMRIASRDLDIGDSAVPSGTMIGLLIGSANHDPALPTTRRTRHHAVRLGEHLLRTRHPSLLGAPLARLEARIALEVLLERFGRIGFGTRPPTYRRSIVMRGPEHLEVRVRRDDGG